MNFDDLDNYLVNQIHEGTEICSSIVVALKGGKIDKTCALEVLDKAKSMITKTFDQRCALYEANKMDYSSIENARYSFVNSLDDAVYEIINPKDYSSMDTRIDDLLR